MALRDEKAGRELEVAEIRAVVVVRSGTVGDDERHVEPHLEPRAERRVEGEAAAVLIAVVVEVSAKPKVATPRR
jgi:hypothetical protein